MQAARRRGEELGLTEEELAFYDALETNDSAVQVLGDAQAAHDCTRAGLDGAGERAGKFAGASASDGSLRYGYPPETREQATRDETYADASWEKQSS